MSSWTPPTKFINLTTLWHTRCARIARKNHHQPRFERKAVTFTRERERGWGCAAVSQGSRRRGGGDFCLVLAKQRVKWRRRDFGRPPVQSRARAVAEGRGALSLNRLPSPSQSLPPSPSPSLPPSPLHLQADQEETRDERKGPESRLSKTYGTDGTGKNKPNR